MKKVFELKRVIVFTPNVPLLIEFYSDLLNISKNYIDNDGKWGEISAGNTNIAFHFGKKRKSKELIFKLVFYSNNIAKERDNLIKRGYNPGKLFKSEKFEFFNLNDPDGNVIQFSGRE